MGRRKIKIERIRETRTRNVTFHKRKVGVMKKSYELATLCGADVALLIIYDGKVSQYSSIGLDHFLAKFSQGHMTRRVDVRTNREFANLCDTGEGDSGDNSNSGDMDDPAADRTAAAAVAAAAAAGGAGVQHDGSSMLLQAAAVGMDMDQFTPHLQAPPPPPAAAPLPSQYAAAVGMPAMAQAALSDQLPSSTMPLQMWSDASSTMDGIPAPNAPTPNAPNHSVPGQAIAPVMHAQEAMPMPMPAPTKPASGFEPVDMQQQHHHHHQQQQQQQHQQPSQHYSPPHASMNGALPPSLSMPPYDGASSGHSPDTTHNSPLIGTAPGQPSLFHTPPPSALETAYPGNVPPQLPQLGGHNKPAGTISTGGGGGAGASGHMNGHIMLAPNPTTMTSRRSISAGGQRC